MVDDFALVPICLDKSDNSIDTLVLVIRQQRSKGHKNARDKPVDVVYAQGRLDFGRHSNVAVGSQHVDLPTAIVGSHSRAEIMRLSVKVGANNCSKITRDQLFNNLAPAVVCSTDLLAQLLYLGINLP